MKASELRIGNFVWNETQNKAVQVDLKILSEQLYSENKWPAVPLTVEWLVKLGLLRNMGGYSLNDVWIEKDGVDWYLQSPENQSMGIPIKYVHQLQNLYFALTGEELTLKR